LDALYRYLQSIAITGGGSGIGAALAMAYARPGAFLFLSDINQKNLDTTAATCAATGATVFTKIVDVRNADAVAEWIDASNASKPIELVIANAGVANVTLPTDIRGDIEAETRAVFDININGVVNTVFPAAKAIGKHGQGGQIAIVSSLASFNANERDLAYSASKGAVRLLGEGLRLVLSKAGIGVTTICPGFISTPLVASFDGPTPFLINLETAIPHIVRGISLNKYLITFPFGIHILAWYVSSLPWVVREWISQGPNLPLVATLGLEKSQSVLKLLGSASKNKRAIPTGGESSTMPINDTSHVMSPESALRRRRSASKTG
jgi:NAD(P)-dependent dehydrogenase (short-subunit alcohol dehydrogenase family)